MTYAATLSAALRSLVDRSGLPIPEIAADLGVDRATLYRWLEGRADGRRVDRILRAIGASPDELVTEMERISSRG